ncbi:MAG: pantoate--beta-alanine ligase, partial [Candidatus Margulisbacteria bacterium]|nr:pantoate--beta-alanine ligase [Candidatus Margulisiibacteriota bacterium]
HEGHLSLVEAARKKCDFLVVSIFVNPKQFGPNEDFKNYPRDLNKDLALLTPYEIDVVFTPEAEAMFPAGFSANVEINGGLVEALCGKSRPGHFSGVLTVVAKLFNLTRPDLAFFGEKDYQQQLIIRKMTKDLNFPIEIVTMPTIREANGLAKSSRNDYLKLDEREAAGVIFRALQLAKEKISKEPINAIKQQLRELVEKEPLAKIDYIELADPETLAEAGFDAKKVLVALAIWIGQTRLIDNLVVEKK